MSPDEIDGTLNASDKDHWPIYIVIGIPQVYTNECNLVYTFGIQITM